MLRACFREGRNVLSMQVSLICICGINVDNVVPIPLSSSVHVVSILKITMIMRLRCWWEMGQVDVVTVETQKPSILEHLDAVYMSFQPLIEKHLPSPLKSAIQSKKP